MTFYKDNNYLEKEIAFSLLGRAIAHPARIRMIRILEEKPQGVRNVDFTKIMGFAKSTIKKHIDILKDAELVNTDYFTHHYMITLNEKGRRVFEEFDF